MDITEKLETIYDKESEVYDETRYECKAGDYFFDMETKHLLKILAPGNVLELGCGTGQFSVFLARNGFEDITGIDLSSGMLHKAKIHAERNKVGSKIKFLQMNARELEFQDETFDNVIAVRCFRFLGLKALDEAYRVLKPKGRLIIMDLSADYIYNKIPTPWGQFSDGELMHIFSIDELKKEFQSLDLTPTYVKTFYLLPPPVYYHAPKFSLNIISKYDDIFKKGRVFVIEGIK